MYYLFQVVYIIFIQTFEYHVAIQYLMSFFIFYFFILFLFFFLFIFFLLVNHFTSQPRSFKSLKYHVSTTIGILVALAY